MLLALSSGVGLWAMVLITRLPPLPNCEHISAISADSERLYCAKQAAISGTEQELISGVKLVGSWQPSHPLYKDSQTALNRWTKSLLTLAQQRMEQGSLAKAQTLVGHIPPRAEVYERSQADMQRWQEEWDTGTAQAKAIDTAIANENWSGARRELQVFKGLTSDYWVKNRHRYWGKQIQKEEDARRTLIQAESLAASGQIEDLAQGVTLARQLPSNSRAWSDAKPLIDRWSEQLVKASFRRWEQEDFDGAVTLVQQVPIGAVTAPEAQDLVRFAQAQRLGSVETGWLPTYGQLLQLREAIAAAQAISPDSIFYDEAQEQLGLWQEQLADLHRLYGAHLAASFGHRAGLRTAIEQAQQIAADRPQRQQAQTLVAHWAKEIERIEDRPILVRARKIATAGDKASLEQAIQTAANVELGRALRVEAQTLIAEWNKQIQILEDQPFYRQALALASSGKLGQAIDEAKKIQPGRALHTQAQASIREWTTQLQVAADRPILTRAEALAYAGRLTDAIATASQIAPGRALYREAQNSIAIWDAERGYIRSLQAPADSELDYSTEPEIQ